MQLREMRENDPTAKALVFSQFVSTIEWLKGKLREHGFGYRTISGSMPQKQRAKVVTVRQSSTLTLHVCCTHWALSVVASVSSCLPFMTVGRSHMPCSRALSAASFTKSCSWLYAGHLSSKALPVANRVITRTTFADDRA